MEISGSCFCNAVQYRLNSEPKAVVNCHCNFCRKHSGASFSTYVVIPEGALEIISGQELIASHGFREDAHKHFCRQCGSPIYNRNARYSGLCMVYIGGLSASEDLVPGVNIYCESQLAWIPAITKIRSFSQGIAGQPRQA